MTTYALIQRLAIPEYCLRRRLLAYAAILPLGLVTHRPNALPAWCSEYLNHTKPFLRI